MLSAYVASRYNFCVPLDSGALLYNVSSGALSRFDSGDGIDLANLLGSSPVPYVERSSFPEAAWDFLLSAGYVVRTDTDEVAEIKRRYWRARIEAPLVVTITVTQDCNLRCFYCYEERTTDRLESDDVAPILSRMDESIRQSAPRAVHVDWYGGEPLLNAEFVEQASHQIQTFVRRRGLGYSASIISNGTGWPLDPVEFVRRHSIREVQISFDGDQKQHDRYRAFRKGKHSSFTEAVRVVDALAPECKVNVLLNLDRRSVRSLDRFLAFATERRWFIPPNQAVLQPARIAAFSKRSAFMQTSQLSVTEFEAVKAHIRSVTAGAIPIQEAETLGGFPSPRMSVCAALGSASFVVGADRKEYRCGLQVGEKGRAVGTLGLRPRRLPLLEEREECAPDGKFWAEFDPTERPRCARCSFLPVCWGGCPKGHLEGNQHAIDEQGRYWRENLARLIAAGAGARLTQPLVFEERFQIRSPPCESSDVTASAT